MRVHTSFARQSLTRAARSRNGVTAAGHAGAERAVVVGLSLIELPLLLGHVVLLLLLLLLVPLRAPHHAEQGADPGADGRALTSISPDRPADRAERRPTRRAGEQSALRRARRGRWRRGDARVRGIESALLHGPAVALSAIELLLLRGLTPVGIDVGLRQRRRWQRQ